MSEAPLPNDEAARSPTGEIIDTRDVPTTKGTETTSTSTTTTSTETPPSTETTATEDGKTLLTKPSDKPTEPPKAPETYAAFKAPEGHTLDPKLIEAATPIFKELGLTQEQAQRLVDIQITRELALAKAPQDTYETTRAKWQTDTLADPEIKAAGIDTVKADIGRALTALGDTKLAADFKAAMDLTGAGDNPAFVKTFWKLAQFATEGKHVSGRGPSTFGQQAPGTKENPGAARSLYPNLPSAG